MSLNTDASVDAGSHRELTGFLRDARRRARSALIQGGLRNADLEDCTQDVLIDLVKHWTQLRCYAPGARIGYLYAVCRGTLSDWRRRVRRAPDLFETGEPDDEPDLELTRCGDREYFGLRVRAAVQLALAASEPDVRATFLLVCVVGHTEAEAASLQRVTRGTVASRLRRVRSRVRHALVRSEARLTK